ncbi:MAG: NusA-like transcription termination signal-binding factor [Nanoarchaeota archaeon]|nr:NusA-like transcription termination signal-binding factor [Nanoarchaeota archaeon]
MSRVKLDQETLGLSSLLEKRTHALVKDCFKDNETIYFVVAQGEMGKALGKGAENVRRLQQELGKRIRIIEYADTVIDFIRNIISPLRVEEIVEENSIVYLKDSRKKTKSLLIGRDGRNLQLIQRAVTRFFNVEVKVI